MDGRSLACDYENITFKNSSVTVSANGSGNMAFGIRDFSSRSCGNKSGESVREMDFVSSKIADQKYKLLNEHGPRLEQPKR